jgi:hypothetical protein
MTGQKYCFSSDYRAITPLFLFVDRFSNGFWPDSQRLLELFAWHDLFVLECVDHRASRFGCGFCELLSVYPKNYIQSPIQTFILITNSFRIPLQVNSHFLVKEWYFVIYICKLQRSQWLRSSRCQLEERGIE